MAFHRKRRFKRGRRAMSRPRRLKRRKVFRAKVKRKFKRAVRHAVGQPTKQRYYDAGSTATDGYDATNTGWTINGAPKTTVTTGAQDSYTRSGKRIHSVGNRITIANTWNSAYAQEQRVRVFVVRQKGCNTDFNWGDVLNSEAPPIGPASMFDSKVDQDNTREFSILFDRRYVLKATNSYQVRSFYIKDGKNLFYDHNVTTANDMNTGRTKVFVMWDQPHATANHPTHHITWKYMFRDTV